MGDKCECDNSGGSVRYFFTAVIVMYCLNKMLETWIEHLERLP